MFPLPLAGLATAGVTLISKYKNNSLPTRRNYRLKTLPIKKYRLHGSTNATHTSLLSMFRDIGYKFAQGFTRPQKDNYESIIKDFLPPGAKILVPQFPIGSQRYLIVDLDGDSYQELITSYKQEEEIKTIILKKQSSSWHKASEISHPSHSTLNFRGVASLSSEDKKQLLIGVTEDGKSPYLFGYSLENDNLNTLFNLPYQRFELTGGQNVRKGSRHQLLAIWERDSVDIDTYSIDLFSLKDDQLKANDNITSYYSRSVIPFYIRRIKKSPYNTESWYNLANALVRIEALNDARIAVDVGSELDVSSKFKERFEDLKSKIK